MYTMFAIILFALPTQTGELPGDAEPVFRITLPDGEIRFGAVRESGQQVTIVFDEPWAPSRPVSYAQGRVTYEPEPKVARDERLAEEGRKAGFVLHETRDGPRWVRQEDLEYYNRARDLLAKPSVPSPIPDEAPATSDTGEASPGFLAQWGLHGLVMVVGVGLGLLVWKTLIAA